VSGGPKPRDDPNTWLQIARHSKLYGHAGERTRKPREGARTPVERLATGKTSGRGCYFACLAGKCASTQRGFRVFRGEGSRWHDRHGRPHVSGAPLPEHWRVQIYEPATRVTTFALSGLNFRTGELHFAAGREAFPPKNVGFAHVGRVGVGYGLHPRDRFTRDARRRGTALAAPSDQRSCRRQDQPGGGDRVYADSSHHS
jgi:hypothetical protein